RTRWRGPALRKLWFARGGMVQRSESRDSHAVERPSAQKVTVLTRWNSPALRKSRFARGGVALRSESCNSHAVESPCARKVVIRTRWISPTLKYSPSHTLAKSNTKKIAFPVR